MPEFVTEFLKKQGGFTLLLILIAWILYGKMERLESRIQNCETEKFQLIVENNERSNVVIQRNTEALIQNTETLESIQAYIGLGATIHQRKKITPLPASPRRQPTN